MLHVRYRGRMEQVCCEECFLGIVVGSEARKVVKNQFWLLNKELTIWDRAEAGSTVGSCYNNLDQIWRIQ